MQYVPYSDEPDWDGHWSVSENIIMIYLTVDEVINWLLLQQSMTPKKLQKMLYYCYAWGLIFFNKDGSNIENKLFDAKFEA